MTKISMNKTPAGIPGPPAPKIKRNLKPSGDQIFAMLCVGAAILLLVGLFAARPFFHWLVMVLYTYPLVTWIPIVVALVIGGGIELAARGRADGLGWATGLFAGAAFWIFCCVMISGWQGNALYKATAYSSGALPETTQPRLLPKVAAKAYGDVQDMQNAHLVINPVNNQLTWSAEKSGGILHKTSEGIGTQPLDRLDGTLMLSNAKFSTAASKLGRGGIKWRGYKKHFFTNIKDKVIVPLKNGKVIAVAPYVGYKGFPVRHPVLKGVYVYHQDGKLEDLTPEQALARPELVASGRIFPEDLARDVAEANGYKTGAGAAFGATRSKVTDPYGNPQPYLTNLGNGKVSWVTVGVSSKDETLVDTVFMTDAASGKTTTWKPKGRLLSNDAAVRISQSLPLEWSREVCCDEDGAPYDVWVRRVEEPRPVFAKGKFYYMTSIIANSQFVTTREPVEWTVIVDAESGEIVGQYNHEEADADDKLRAFFN